MCFGSMQQVASPTDPSTKTALAGPSATHQACGRSTAYQISSRRKDRSWLARIGSEDALFDSGFVSRFFLCLPDSLVGRRDATGELVRRYTEDEIAFDVAKAYEELITTLLDKSYEMEEFCELSLEPGAKKLFATYHDEVEGSLGKGGEREQE